MSGKRAFLDLLKQEGVEIVFGNPGTTELPLMDAFAVENDIRYVLGLQEAALMAMADGYAQASGKLTVLNLHVAPGPRQRHGHALRRAEGGLADPGHRRPAGHRISRHRAGPLRRPADAGAAVRQMGRAGRPARRPAALVHRAAKTALAPPTGPVFLSLPGDILKNEADIDLLDADARRAAHARRRRRGRRRRRSAGQGASGR